MKHLLVEYNFNDEIYKNYIHSKYFINDNSTILFLGLSIILLFYIYFRSKDKDIKLIIIFLLAGGINHFLDLNLQGYILTYINIKNILYINISTIFILIGLSLLFYKITKKNEG